MFEVVYSAEAEIGIVTAYRSIRRRSPLSAGRWLQRLYATIGELTAMPERFAVVDEDAADVGFETREMLFGSRRRGFRIRYRVLQNLVIVLSVEWAGRDR